MSNLDAGFDARLDAIYALDDIGHYDKALELADALIAEQPQQARALAARVRVLCMLGRLDEAQADLEAALALGPDQADVRWARIILESDKETLSPEQIITALRGVVQDAPGHYLAMNSLGYYLMHTGQLAEAEKVLQRVIALRPDRIRPQHNLQRLFMWLGRSDDEYRSIATPEVLDAYIRRTQLDPQDAQASYDLGTMLYGLNRHAEAQPHLDNARRIWGEQNAIQHNRALNLRALARQHETEKNWDQAFACYREAIAEWDLLLTREPDWDWAIDGRIEALFLMAHAHWMRDELDKALAIVDPLVAQDCPNPRVWNMAGLCRMERSQYREALPFLQRALELDPDASFVYMNLGRALLALDEPQKALERAEQGLALEPDMLPLHELRARALVALGRVQEAIAQYRKALEIHPDAQTTRKAFVDFLFDQEQFEPMYPEAQRLVESGAHPGWAEWALGSSLLGLGRKEEARAAFVKARDAYLEQDDQNNAQFCQGKVDALDTSKAPDKPKGGFFSRLFGRK